MADAKNGGGAPDWRSSLREAGPYLGLGMQLAFTLLAFTLGGFFLDQRLETLPWLTIAGAIVGLVLLFLQLYRTAVDISNRSRARNRGSE